MSSATPLYLDCDTGIDDALALTYLLNSPSVTLVGIGSVFGNVSANEGATNTAALLRSASAAGIPVTVGAHDPRTGTFSGGARHVHGDNGIGGVDLPGGPAVGAEDAADMIIRLANENDGRLEIVAIGPLTNLAIALERDPQLPTKIAQLTIMGGAVWARGNVSPTAEANIRNDPEAARAVLRAGFPVVLVPLDVTMQHTFDDAEVATLRAQGTELHTALGDMLEFYLSFYESVSGVRAAPLHDPLAAAVAAGDLTDRTSRSVPLDVVREGDERGR
ncbi:MAG: nucleoside hydrolase, partial [Mycetocola sp.]